MTPVITVASLRETHYQSDSILYEGVELMVVVVVGVEIGSKVADCGSGGSDLHYVFRCKIKTSISTPLRFDENGVSIALPDSFYM